MTSLDKIGFHEDKMPARAGDPARQILEWHFPLPRPYTGILLGNGNMGVMAWGKEQLCLSIAQNGFWDRRGGVPFATQTDFLSLRGILEANDEAALKRAFSKSDVPPPYRQPTQLPGGRLILHGLGRPVRGLLELDTGRLGIEFSDERTIVFRQAMSKNVLWIGANPERVELIPAWRWIGQTLLKGGVAAPEEWGDERQGGFLQTVPEDPSFAIAWRRKDGGLLVATALGDDARDQVRDLLSEYQYSNVEADADAWWESYRADIPRVCVPDAALQRAWDYGVYKQSGMTPPEAVAATLQGPWMADDGLPAWSNDYHFNINVQLIYGAAYPTNRLDHLRPLWNLLSGWMPRLKENAAAFFKNPSAIMLPTAVDDRCQMVGNFWQGAVDQACAAWMGQLAWLHYRYSMDDQILRDTAWPLLQGAFEGFWSMVEETEGNRLALPVSVSPEFPGWGRNASFQLAAFHMLASLLPKAAKILGEPPDPRWARVSKELPEASTILWTRGHGETGIHRRIALWEGQDLSESHRHHSHLAGIYPFRTIDPTDEQSRELVRHSIEHWTMMGAGQWTGWCVPWAAMIWARCDSASAAVSLLRIWEDVFTNIGYGSLCDADSPGFTFLTHGPLFESSEFGDSRVCAHGRVRELFEPDGGFGVVQAIAEIFVQQRGETLYVLPSIPKQWRDFEFDGILVEGAFLVGATVRNACILQVRITSRAGGRLRVAHGLGECWALDGRSGNGSILDIETRSGESFLLEAKKPSDFSF